VAITDGVRLVVDPVSLELIQGSEVDSLLGFLGLEETMYFALFLWLAIAGGGPISVDAVFEHHPGA